MRHDAAPAQSCGDTKPRLRKLARHEPCSVAAPSSRVPALATLAQKIEAETDTRKLLEDNGLPQPDEVEYGAGCIRLLWHDTKTCVVVDIDEPPDEEDAIRP